MIRQPNGEWRRDYAKGRPLQSAPAPAGDSLIGGSDVTWNDLSLAFLWWTDGVITGRELLLERECLVLEFTTPQAPRQNQYARTRSITPTPPSGGRTWNSETGSWWPAQNQSRTRRNQSNVGAWVVVGVIIFVVLAIIGSVSGGGSSNQNGYPYDTYYDYGYTNPPAQVTPVPVTFPAADPLVAVEDLHSQRTDHTATLLPDGRVVIAGGVTYADATLSALSDDLAVEVYDPATKTFSLDGTLLTGRSLHTATLLKDGTILIAGGGDINGQALDSAETFDPKTGISTPTGPMGTARISAAAVALDDGRVLIVGGSGGGLMLTSAEIYDPQTRAFIPAPWLLDGGGYVTATKLNDGRVLVAGGNTQSSPVDSAELYDPATDSFSIAAYMHEGRQGATSCLLPDGRVLVVGGIDDSGRENATAEVYNPDLKYFGTYAPLGDSRYQNTTTLLQDGSVLLAGGTDNGGSWTSTVERFDPVIGQTTPIGSMAKGRSGHTATLLKDGSVLIVGGWTYPKDILATAGLYVPGVSAPATPTDTPTPTDKSPAASGSPASSDTPFPTDTPADIPSPVAS